MAVQLGIFTTTTTNSTVGIGDTRAACATRT